MLLTDGLRRCALSGTSESFETDDVIQIDLENGPSAATAHWSVDRFAEMTLDGCLVRAGAEFGCTSTFGVMNPQRIQA